MNDQRIDFEWNKGNLYREESITDLKSGSIRVLVPVKPDGSEDISREKLFIGHAQLRSPDGTMVPLQARLQAVNFEEAMERFPEVMTQALQELIEEANKKQAREGTRQQEDSQIIMPVK
jgi:hypothetical protein